MPELRWILLIAGALFLGALAVWEVRRQRRLPPQLEESTHHRFREPTLGLPELRPREGAQELPVVEIDESMVGRRGDGVRIEEELVAVDELAKAAPARPRPAIVADVLLERPADSAARESGAAAEDSSASAGSGADASAGATVAGSAPETPPLLEALSGLPVAPIVEWPPEDQRKFITVRVTARAGEKLSGRAVRLALAAEGFVHGAFSIFHRPEPKGRAVVSAASLTQSGSFDLATMDSHRYGGLAVFVVLPGPLPAAQMMDELLESARNLTQRLQAFLQDERGAPLDAERIAALRASAEPAGSLS